MLVRWFGLTVVYDLVYLVFFLAFSLLELVCYNVWYFRGGVVGSEFGIWWHGFVGVYGLGGRIVI